METYEVQAKAKAGWQIVAVFEGYDGAHECALELDRDRLYDDLRVRREVEDPRTGRLHATTVYRCGQKLREEIAREEEAAAKLAVVEKRQRRLNRNLIQRLTRRAAKEKTRLAAQGSPLRLALWTTLLFVAGMAAVYYFEFVLFNR